MTNARNDVAALIGANSVPADPVTPTPTSNIKVGDTVKIASDATYYTGKTIPDWVKAKQWIVYSVSGDRVVIDKSADGKSSIMSAINAKYLTVVTNTITPSTPTFTPYKIKVTANALNVRAGAGTSYAVTIIIHKGDVYTIVDEKNGWGKLKSGAGWISLQYTTKV